MPIPLARSFRDLVLVLPVLIATALFLALSTPILALVLVNHLAQNRTNATIQEIESASFDLTSLDRTVHAGFLTLLSPPRPSSIPFVDGLSLQARAVQADLTKRTSMLSIPELRALTEIIREVNGYFFQLTRELPTSHSIPSLSLSRHYRDVTFHIAAFGYRLNTHLKTESRDLGHLYRARSILVLFQTVLSLFYAGTVLLLSISRRRTRQVLLDVAAEDSEEMLSIADLTGRVLYANRRFRSFFGQEELPELEGHALSKILRTVPSLESAALSWESFLVQHEDSCQMLLPIKEHRCPELTWLEVRMTPTRIGRRARYLEWKGIDLSRLKNAERALEAQGEWLRTTLASIGDGVIATDISGRVTFLNHVAERLTGYSSSEAQGQPVETVFRIVNEKTGDPVEIPIERVLKNDIVVGLANHTALINRMGKAISISDSAAPIHSREGFLTGVVMVFQENTERRRAQEMIWNLTYRDALTNLPNQSLFHERLTTIIPWARNNQRMLTIVMLDIDLFKRINDSFGHSTGNILLQEFSQRFSLFLSPHDTLARVGGDEFLLLLTECRSEKDVATICKKLSESLEKPFEVSGQELSLSISMGIALFPKDGSDPESLLKNADTALNHAKEAGRNRFVFYEESMSSYTLRNLKLEQALKQGILRGELTLEYQPQVETRNGRIIGAEALVRWDSPDFGRISPADFIPMAERTGLIHPLGTQVLGMALEQVKRWWTDGARLTVSVNISYQHFVQIGFVEEVLSILDRVGIPPHALLIEITESMVIKDSERFFSVVGEFHRQGVKISIDDFGTGATALSYLTSYPIAEVKIDRSLITNLFSDLKRSELVRTIIGLGKRLEFSTTGEGVERPEEWDYLVRHQCDRVQGFLISPPLPPAAFESLFGKRFVLVKGHAPIWQNE